MWGTCASLEMPTAVTRLSMSIRTITVALKILSQICITTLDGVAMTISCVWICKKMYIKNVDIRMWKWYEKLMRIIEYQNHDNVSSVVWIVTVFQIVKQPMFYLCYIFPIGDLMMTCPSKHGIFTQCCFNVGPSSSTLAQHWNSIRWMSRVY